eukprot:m.489921 g.489921  ORF g.489921 m.489921 type:complete len:201 (-) comp27281_c0_seq1:178-780(-)
MAATVMALAILFVSGSIISVALHLLHIEAGIQAAQLEVPAWLPLLCGMVSVLIGSVTAHIHNHYRFNSVESEWENVIRCSIGFLGLCIGSAKLPFENNVELSCSLAGAAVALWWIADRSFPSFALGLCIALVGTITVQWLAYNEVLEYTKPDFFYVRSWLPCVLFAGSVTAGALGRRLFTPAQMEEHRDSSSKRILTTAS